MSFFSRKKSFDIQACRKGRWTIEQTATDQASAEAAAKALFAKLKDIEAVRVAIDGADDKVVFEQKKPEGKAPMAVPQIEEAPLCAGPDDLNGAAARKAMNRLFRAYLDKAQLTPSEIMHNGREMKRILDFESIVQTAIDRTARVQKGAEGEDAKKRVDALWRLSEAVSRRAAEADKLQFPAIKTVGFDEAVRTVAKSAKPEETAFLLRCLLSRELSQTRSWYGKLIQLLEWCSTAREQAGLALLDDFISDTLASASLVTDIVGQQPNLAAAIVKLLDVADGVYKPGKGQSAEMASLEEMLCKLLKAGRLPASREFLLERVASELKSASPLSKRDAEGEFERYDEVLARVLLPTGVAGGTDMAEALLVRAAGYLNLGGAAGQREALGWMALRGPSRVAMAHFFLVIMRSRLGPALETAPASQLQTLIGGVETFAELVGTGGNPMAQMRAATSLWRAIEGAAGLPPGLVEAAKQKLDDLLFDYVVKGKIVQQVDNPGWKLHTRAFMLMQMCMPDVLPDGKAIAVAREAVVAHLRRPNFEVELVAGIADPAEQKKIILQCHQLMKAGGFK